MDVLVPGDALTSSVDEVVDLVNVAVAKQPDVDEGRTVCGGQGAATQVLWFSYAETSVAVTYNDGTCDDLGLGSRQVDGGDEVAAASIARLWQQRDRRRPPDVDERARCAPNLTEDTPLVISESIDLVDAVICEFEVGVRQARLTPAALTAVGADFATTEGYHEERSCPTRMMRGITGWGDRFTWWASCWDFDIPNTYSTGLHWQATPAVRHLLGSLPLGRTREQVTTQPGHRD